MHLANASGSKVRESLFLCINAKLQEVTIATPAGCCSGQLCTEVQETHSVTSGLLLCTLDPNRPIMVLGLSFGILQKKGSGILNIC